MPRKQFVADLQKVCAGLPPPGILALRAGEDDGSMEFEFLAPNSSLPEPVNVTAMVTDVSDYPSSHEYMIFAGGNAPPHIACALENIRATNRKTVFELLDIVSTTLSRAALDRDGDVAMPDSQLEEDELGSEDDDDDIYDDDHEAFEIGAQHTATLPMPDGKPKPTGRVFRTRIRQDLIAAKKAGFKVGHQGHLLDGHNAFVTVSIRVAKLGISEEAMQAWHVDPKDYLILIIQYPNGYKTNEELQGCDSMRLAPNLGMRLCAGKKYKPTLQEAIKAFTVVKKSDRELIPSNDLPAAESQDIEEDTLRDTFISKPLNGFLQERLVPLLRYRSAGLDWAGAENMFNEVSSKGASGADAVPDRFYQPEVLHDALPAIIKADHYTARGITQYSFPLLAIQFALRHFTRCTEFCLVCHSKLTTDFEAIKPYVCDKPLCLYQYMTLGFGPSIEHEILTQPYVVDLLLSFCYSSAYARKLKDYPDGLALMVPPIDHAVYDAAPDPYNQGYAYRGRGQKAEDAKKPPAELPIYEVGVDLERLEMIFFDKRERPFELKRGSWVVIKMQNSLNVSELHCRIADVTYYPTVSIDQPVSAPVQQQGAAQAAGPATTVSTPDRTITPAATPKWAPATFQIYEQDFEQLDKAGKCISICKLLDTMPNVKDMQKHLEKKSSGDLKNWVSRVSPPTLSLLRWVIASNRACIMQVDGQTGANSQDRLYGMKDYMQFRFAMGAPDKEQRFVTEVRNVSQRLNLTYPTIFAWHGSPVQNWHMIIREGLHFNNADHGRAYGDGVYHAKDASTSMSYSGMGYGGAAGSGAWPNSLVRVQNALALNEIVNAPAEFQSSNPYYVVKQLDWIQTRYLFVSCTPSSETSIALGVEKKPTIAYKQDPSRTPSGVGSGAVVIPASAIKHRSNTAEVDDDMSGTKSPNKRLKGMGGFNNPIAIDDDDDVASVTTDAEDLEILFEEDEEVEIIAPPLPKPQAWQGTPTDFVPGTLDFKKLPIMPPPSYANSAATKRLMKELQALQKVQESTADLGWYIDVEKIENPYQWIVELHSFHVIDPNLRLVADMKKQKLPSIVLEINFNKDYPFTPPYIRVIRPRFLSLAQGGGGHIVMGGAMCMELLTNTGWSSVSSMESVLMQVRLAIASDPPARVDMGSRGGDYGTAEAAEGYLRACATHGWIVPPGFKEMAYGIRVDPSQRS